MEPVSAKRRNQRAAKSKAKETKKGKTLRKAKKLEPTKPLMTGWDIKPNQNA